MHRSSSALVFEVPDEKELVQAPDCVTSEIATISLWAVEMLRWVVEWEVHWDLSWYLQTYHLISVDTAGESSGDPIPMEGVKETRMIYSSY